jgi:peptidyl-prolyl cis-trans isomerase C
MQHNLKTIVIALSVALAAASAPVAFAQTKAEKAEKAEKASAKAAKVDGRLSVNGVIIPNAYFDAMNREREQSGQPASPDFANAMKDELVNREVLSQAAKKKGIDKSPIVVAQMDMARQAVLIRAYFDDYVKANPISDAQLKADYDKYVVQLGDKEYKVRHILVDKEDDAKAIIASIKRGETFEKLAKEKSKDTGSKDNGGDLDWAPAGRYVPEFANAVKALPKGQLTENPIKSPFGYHVIRVDDSRAMKVPGFDEVKDKFRQQAQQDQVARLIQELRGKAKIEEK